MNGLSWLLYAGEVTDNVRITSVVFLLVGTLVGSFVSAFAAIELELSSEKIMSAWIKVIPAVVIAAGALVLLPSKNTLMLIAASEVGETVLASKDVQNIGGEAGALATDSLKLLRKYVTEQLGEGEGK